MASTKESNTSKTAHVMNLLSRTRSGAASEPAEGAEGAPAQPAAAPAAAAPQIPPILSSMEADAAVSTQIKDALEDALASALEEDPLPAPTVPPEVMAAPQTQEPAPESGEDAPVLATVQPAGTESTPAPAVQWPELDTEGAEPEAPAAPQASAAVVPETPPAPAPVQQTPPAPSAPPAASAPDAPAPAEAPAHEAAAPEKTAESAPPDDSQQEREITYVNVMEVLVEERAGKYMEMFGMCQCDRCRSDVKALALNSLPSKYVVMARGEFVPRITVYEGRFSAAIIAQLLRACKIVMDSPRHNQQEF